VAFRKDPKNVTGNPPNEAESKQLASETWEETVRIRDGDDAETLKFGEATAEQLKTAGIPFQRTKEGKLRRGLITSDVTRLENTLRGIGVSKPDKVDSLYSNLVQQYARAVKNKDFFRASQLIIEYKKEVDARK